MDHWPFRTEEQVEEAAAATTAAQPASPHGPSRIVDVSHAVRRRREQPRALGVARLARDEERPAALRELEGAWRAEGGRAERWAR